MKVLFTVVAMFVLLNTRIPDLVKDKDDEFIYGTFPEGFMWGVGTSSYQIEGSWNEDGKGESIWDFWSHENNGSNIAQGHNGDIACDSYHKYLDDVKLLKDMGVILNIERANFYRFSLSWPRLIPTGKIADGINQAGIDHYSKLIDTLLSNGIIPFITLYHWDLPMNLLNEGGWLEDSIVDHFKDYATLAFESYGDRVKWWFTFNEPRVFCLVDWNYGNNNPFVEPPEKPYICAHNVVLSHAAAFRVYDQLFRPSQMGKMGISLNCDWPEPQDSTDDPDFVAASDRTMHFRYGWWANPLTRGQYPPIMRELIDQKSATEGRNSSRLPTFDAAWTELINGTLDFLGLNHYGTFHIQPSDGTNGWLDGDGNVRLGPNDPAWNRSGIGWTVVPWGFRKIINWIYKEYKLPIYVTENGFGAIDTEGIEDPERLNYYRAYINEMLKSVLIDGSDVRAYTAWSLMDNFEWARGYTARYGVHWVDFTDPERPRTPKDSARELTTIFKDNGFPSNSYLDL